MDGLRCGNGPRRDLIELDAEDHGTKEPDQTDDDREQQHIEQKAGAGHLGQGDQATAENDGVGGRADRHHVGTVGRKCGGDEEQKRILTEAQGNGTDDGQKGGGRGRVARELGEHENAKANDREGKQDWQPLESLAQFAEINGQPVGLNITGQTEATTEQQQDIPGQTLGRRPVHDEFSTRQV